MDYPKLQIILIVTLLIHIFQASLLSEYEGLEVLPTNTVLIGLSAKYSSEFRELEITVRIACSKGKAYCI